MSIVVIAILPFNWPLCEAKDFSSNLCPDQPPAQWVPGVVFPGSKGRPKRDADHFPF
jgi:hypothetical protein